MLRFAYDGSSMQIFFTVLITLQFVVIVLHDLIHIPGWTHAQQVREVIGRNKLIIATAINAIFPGLAAGFAIYYFARVPPKGVVDYWAIYCGITLGSAIMMWYLPYFFGANEKKRRMYTDMYAGTIRLLPPRGIDGENPRPNLLHLFFHTLFLATFVLAVMLRSGRSM
jgi:hypothetical protein